MKKRRITPPARPGKELARLLNSLGHRYPIDRVFRDWLEMSAIAVSNSVDRSRFAAREERYLSIVKQYERPEVYQLCEMFSYLVMELDITRECVIAPLISDLELGTNKKRMGQFFTPWTVSYMMAKMTFTPKSDIEKKIAEQGYITAMEPACGMGGMVLAMARALEDEGFNYQKCLHVFAVDIDPLCVHATYLQASLMGIPAIVIQGDSLRATETDHWFTPLHVLGGWNWRLRNADRINAQQASNATSTGDAATADVMDRITDILPTLDDVNEPMPAPQELEEVLTPQVIASRMGRWRLEHAAGSAPPFPVSTAT